MTDREDEAKPYDERMLELLEVAASLISPVGAPTQRWRESVASWHERYAKLLTDRAQP